MFEDLDLHLNRQPVPVRSLETGTQLFIARSSQIPGLKEAHQTILFQFESDKFDLPDLKQSLQTDHPFLIGRIAEMRFLFNWPKDEIDETRTRKDTTKKESGKM